MRSVLKPALFAVFLAIASLVLLEAVFFVYIQLKEDKLIQRHNVLHHAWTPNLDHKAQSRGTELELRTNSLGWVEDREFPKQKPQGTYRIFLVGDSNTQGVVTDRYKWANLLEQRLNAAGTPFRNIEVINTGTSSYSTVIYAALINRYLLDYDPDLIIINLDLNDIRDDSAYRDMVVRDGDRIVAVHNPRRTAQSKLILTPDGWRREQRSWFYIWLVNHSSLMHYVDLNLGHFLAARAGVKRQKLYTGANWHDLNWTDEIRKNIDYSMGELRKLIVDVRSRGVDVIVTGVPHLPQFTGEWNDQTHKALEQAVAGTGALYLNCFEAIEARGGREGAKELYFAADPTHFNEAGNAALAEIHFNFLMKHAKRLLRYDP